MTEICWCTNNLANRWAVCSLLVLDVCCQLETTLILAHVNVVLVGSIFVNGLFILIVRPKKKFVRSKSWSKVPYSSHNEVLLSWGHFGKRKIWIAATNKLSER